MDKSTRKRRKHHTLGLNAGDVERVVSECPAHMSLKVKMALLNEIAEFDKDKARQARNDAGQSARGGPNVDAYQEWLERNQGHEPREANPDTVSDEDGIKYTPSKRDYQTEALLKEFRQSLTDKQLQVWNLVMRHRMSYRKAADLLGIGLSTLRDHLRLAKRQFRKFAEAIRNAEG